MQFALLAYQYRIFKSRYKNFNECNVNFERARRYIKDGWNSLAFCKPNLIMWYGSRRIVGIIVGPGRGSNSSDISRKCKEYGISETFEYLISISSALTRTRFRNLGAKQYKRLEKATKFGYLGYLELCTKRWCPLRQPLKIIALKGTFVSYYKGPDSVWKAHQSYGVT